MEWIIDIIKDAGFCTEEEITNIKEVFAFYPTLKKFTYNGVEINADDYDINIKTAQHVLNVNICNKKITSAMSIEHSSLAELPDIIGEEKAKDAMNYLDQVNTGTIEGGGFLSALVTIGYSDYSIVVDKGIFANKKYMHCAVYKFILQ